MDALNVYLPIAGIEFNILLLVAIGFCVGVLGGFFGVGGGWIVTPALNIFGFNIAFAIGTDLAHIFGNSVISTSKHARMGNVDWKLGCIMAVAAMAGLEGGAQLVMVLEHLGSLDFVVRWLYMALLFGFGTFMLYDYATFGRPRQSEINPFTGPQRVGLAERLRRWHLPPMISLPTSGIRRISLWVIVAVALLTGFLSGLLGVGGGFILVPVLIYLIGCPTAVAVGTSLLCVCFTGAYGCFTFSLKGRTELVAAVIMLGGAAIGAQIGVTAMRYVRGYGIRLLFAVMIILAGAAIALKQAHLDTLAGILVMTAAGGMTLLITYKLIRGAGAEKTAR